ncbi:MAG: DCC1-like thiol-disulfide oxidoreductase family protein [Thiolinea sp.]
MATLKPNALFYDGDCPFCSRYSELMQARDKLGQFAIISLREDQDSVEEFRDLGLDLEQGFVFRYNGEIYHGADAMNVLATVTQQKDPLLRLNHWFFGKRTISKWLYPVLRFGRWLVLRVLKGPDRPRL